MDRYFDRMDERWRAFPVKKQRKYMLYLFSGYLLLTVCIILKVWHDIGNPDRGMVIEHIESPVLRKEESAAPMQDSLLITKKNK